MSDEIEILARLETRGFAGRPGWTILKATFVGMAVMSIVILLGLHPLIASAGLIGGILFVLLRGSGPTTFTLTREGFRRSQRASWGGAVREAFFAFDDVEAYRLGTDLNRRMQEVESLRIELRRAPGVIVVTDQVNPTSFAAFRDAFVEAAERYGAGKGAAPTPTRGQVIVRRRPFYDSLLAKGLTLLFAAFSIGLVYAGARGLLNETHLLRLGLVVLPGTAYMVWRTFLGRG